MRATEILEVLRNGMPIKENEQLYSRINPLDESFRDKITKSRREIKKETREWE